MVCELEEEPICSYEKRRLNESSWVWSYCLDIETGLKVENRKTEKIHIYKWALLGINKYKQQDQKYSFFT